MKVSTYDTHNNTAANLKTRMTTQSSRYASERAFRSTGTFEAMIELAKELNLTDWLGMATQCERTDAELTHHKLCMALIGTSRTQGNSNFDNTNARNVKGLDERKSLRAGATNFQKAKATSTENQAKCKTDILFDHGERRSYIRNNPPTRREVKRSGANGHALRRGKANSQIQIEVLERKLALTYEGRHSHNATRRENASLRAQLHSAREVIDDYIDNNKTVSREHKHTIKALRHKLRHAKSSAAHTTYSSDKLVTDLQHMRKNDYETTAALSDMETNLAETKSSNVRLRNELESVNASFAQYRNSVHKIEASSQMIQASSRVTQHQIEEALVQQGSTISTLHFKIAKLEFTLKYKGSTASLLAKSLVLLNERIARDDNERIATERMTAARDAEHQNDIGYMNSELFEINSELVQTKSDLSEERESVSNLKEQLEYVRTNYVHDVEPFIADSDVLQIGRTLGSGTFGVVVEATDMRTGTVYAVKMMEKDAPDGDYQAELRSAWQDEISNLELVIGVEGIVQLCGHCETNENFYIVLAYCCGGNLHKFIQEKGKQTGVLVKCDMLDLIDGLQELHYAYILHKDIKSENILIDSEGSYVYADLGMSEQNVTLKTSGANEFGGTPLYQPPEVLGNEAHGLSADVYSLGLVFLEMQTGFSFSQLAEFVDKYSNRTHTLESLLQLEGLSHSAIEVLKGMLDLDPETRLDLEEIRGLSFFAGVLGLVHQVE